MIRAQPLRITVLTEEQMIKIHEATLDILGNTGVVVGASEAVDLLYQHGATIEGDIVRIPENLVSQALQSVPDQIGINLLNSCR